MKKSAARGFWLLSVLAVTATFLAIGPAVEASLLSGLQDYWEWMRAAARQRRIPMALGLGL